jgi:hypothetical protein
MQLKIKLKCSKLMVGAQCSQFEEQTDEAIHTIHKEVPMVESYTPSLCVLNNPTHIIS